MSAEARRNGWQGFDGIAEKVDDGWEYTCDGLPTYFGCPERVIVTRRWTTAGTKKAGWVVCYGKEAKPGAPGGGRFAVAEDWEDDPDVVLTFCPSCAAVVREQAAP
jgi:hypothetical protein